VARGFDPGRVGAERLAFFAVGEVESDLGVGDLFAPSGEDAEAVAIGPLVEDLPGRRYDQLAFAA
jgi:hypothetical protein